MKTENLLTPRSSYELIASPSTSEHQPDSSRETFPEGAACPSLNEWQIVGLARLLEIFKGRTPQLKQMLGELENPLNGQRFAETGNRSLRARDAAFALIVGYNRDLFADKQRRELAGLALGLEESCIPNRWERGRESARNFICRLGCNLCGAQNCLELVC